MADTVKCRYSEYCESDAIFEDNDSDSTGGPLYLCQSHAADVALDWMVEAGHFISIDS